MNIIKNVLDSKTNKKFIDHYVEIDGCIRTCIYKGTIICMINEATKEYHVDLEHLKEQNLLDFATKYIRELRTRKYKLGGNN